MILKKLEQKDINKEKVAIKLLMLMKQPNFFIPAYLAQINDGIIMQRVDLDLFTFIRQRAEENNPLSISEIKVIFSQICRGIHILFNIYKCTYLDIKTENIGINPSTLKIYFIDLGSINSTYHTINCLNFIYATNEERMVYALGVLLIELFSTDPIFEDIFINHWKQLKSTNLKFSNTEILDIFKIVVETSQSLLGNVVPNLVELINKIFVLKCDLTILELYNVVINDMVSNASMENNVSKKKIRKLLNLDSFIVEKKRMFSCLKCIFSTSTKD